MSQKILQKHFLTMNWQVLGAGRLASIEDYILRVLTGMCKVKDQGGVRRNRIIPRKVSFNIFVLPSFIIIPNIINTHALGGIARVSL